MYESLTLINRLVMKAATIRFRSIVIKQV